MTTQEIETARFEAQLWHNEQLRKPFYSARFYAADIVRPAVVPFYGPAEPKAGPVVTRPVMPWETEQTFDSPAYICGHTTFAYGLTNVRSIRPVRPVSPTAGGWFDTTAGRWVWSVYNTTFDNFTTERIDQAAYSPTIVGLCGIGERTYTDSLTPAERFHFEHFDRLELPNVPQLSAPIVKRPKTARKTNGPKRPKIKPLSKRAKLLRADERAIARSAERSTKARKVAGKGKSGLATIYGGERKYAAHEALQLGAVWALKHGQPIFTENGEPTKLVMRAGWHRVVDAYRSDYRALCGGVSRAAALAFMRAVNASVSGEAELDALFSLYVPVDLQPAAKLLASKMTKSDIAIRLGISRPTLDAYAQRITMHLLGGDDERADDDKRNERAAKRAAKRA